MSKLTILKTEIRTIDNFYSLNDLHQVSGSAKKHQPANFVRLDQTQALIKEIDRSSDLRNATKTQQGGLNQGTFVCKELVYAYAMWISPKFNLQVIRAFDQIQNPNCLCALANNEQTKTDGIDKAKLKASLFAILNMVSQINDEFGLDLIKAKSVKMNFQN